jgi:hypothetical protein
MTRTISVVIPTYNRAANLPRLLPPLLDDTASTEIVVVDDGGSDGSFEWLRKQAEIEPRLISIRTQNRGEGRARQAGAEVATGDVVLFLDDDVLAGEGLVSAHLAAHGDRQDLVVVGYMPVDLETGPPSAAARLYAREYEARVREYERAPASILRHLWAGNFSLTRTHAVKLPMYRDEFEGLYFPDRELGLRCAHEGLVGFFSRSLAASHLHERSPHNFVRDSIRQGAGTVALRRHHPDHESRTEPRWVPRQLSAGARDAWASAASKPVVLRAILRTAFMASAVTAATGRERLENGIFLLLRRIGWVIGVRAQERGQLPLLLAEFERTVSSRPDHVPPRPRDAFSPNPPGPSDR